MSPKNNKKVPLFGVGIAGNFAGHLQQTGEANGLQGQIDASSPQAIFPFYVSGASEAYLTVNPYSFDTVRLPQEPSAKVQMEPEIALVARIKYLGDSVIGIEPESMTLLNDVTYRNAKVTKLAEKKNWGQASKGIAKKVWPLERFGALDNLDKYRFCSFHHRDGQWASCCKDVSLSDYSYSYEKLITWVMSQFNTQRDQGALHDLRQLVAEAGYPERMIISLGSSRYTEYGEQHQLLDGDELCAVLYDATRIDAEQIADLIESGQFEELAQNQIVLRQTCQAWS
ncbi:MULTISPECIES: DUF5718 family protein [unclassified Vibrio]|uniref:DUF5718 family protein n=1 Tax=unclassified Vibrio TaxID=2614977 RepID=UPI0010A681F4|nr:MULTISPECIES: DUF5718 family protein [unclassified Vibrio]WGY44981.1 hypothetical protein J0X00_04560 [Vibrio sp. ABG19]